MWYLEKNKPLDDVQSGFRRQRSTVDHLVELEMFVSESFVRKLHAVTVFFDLKKAYDVIEVWCPSILVFGVGFLYSFGISFNTENLRSS